jgi:sulfur carrier protein
MLIKVNGQESEVSKELSIQELISARGLFKSTVIVELNGAIIHRESWANTQIKSDDCLEIIHILGGG